jgi:hypothetical protein
MKKTFKTSGNLALICIPFLVFGCASEPVPEPKPEAVSGDTMIRESQGIANLGERWQEGKRMVDSGNAKVSEGEAKITEGKRMIEEGNKIISESEEHYKSIKK